MDGTCMYTPVRCAGALGFYGRNYENSFLVFNAHFTWFQYTPPPQAWVSTMGIIHGVREVSGFFLCGALVVHTNQEDVYDTRVYTIVCIVYCLQYRSNLVVCVLLERIYMFLKVIVNNGDVHPN